MMSSIVLAWVVDRLPPDIGILRDEAAAEGYRSVDRLIRDWLSGVVRFQSEGEVLLAARSGGVLAAVGGLTIEPVVPAAMRMRRFYVHPNFRRKGIGRRLANALLGAAPSGLLVTVNSGNPGANPFWLSLGFSKDHQDGHTHVFVPA